MSDETNIPENVPVLGPAPLRDNLIATAVKFLQNPKVQSSGLDQKRNFLKRKGLTDEEIEKAVEISGAANAVIPQTIPPTGAIQPPIPIPPNQLVVPSHPISTWSKIRDYSALTIIIGGVLYGIYSMFKKYIEPYFIRRHAEQDEKLTRMEKGITDLNTDVKKNMQELQSAMKDLHDQLNEQNMKIANVSTNLALFKDTAGMGTSNSALGELQAEITSVKGLLLSTKQFPATPVVPPVIPSWQMQSANTASTSEPQRLTSDKYTAGGTLTVPEAGDSEASSQHEKNENILSNGSENGTMQNRRDLEQDDFEEEDSNVDPIHGYTGEKTHSLGDSDEYAKMNGHTLSNGILDNGISISPNAINGGLINRPGSMLVSPTKMGVLPSSPPEGEPIGGESELD